MTSHSSVMTAVERVPFEILGVSTIVETPGKLSKEQKDLCIQLWGKEVPKEDADLFFAQAEHFGLSPFAVGQIWGVPRTQNGKTRLVTQIGINGLVLIADRTGKYLGMTDPEWCRLRRIPGTDEPDPDAPEVWRGLWTFKEPPDAARVGVWRLGAPLPMRMTANWREYAEYTNAWEPVTDAQGRPVLKADGKQQYRRGQGERLTDMWARMPAGQLAKCAAALALRRCFQQEFAGLRASFSPADLSVPSAARVSDLYNEPEDEPQAPQLPQGRQQQIEAPAAEPDIRVSDLWGYAVKLGFSRAGQNGKPQPDHDAVHRALGLPETPGALRDWAAQPGNSYRKALEKLRRVAEARREEDAGAEEEPPAEAYDRDDPGPGADEPAWDAAFAGTEPHRDPVDSRRG